MLSSIDYGSTPAIAAFRDAFYAGDIVECIGDVYKYTPKSNSKKAWRPQLGSHYKIAQSKITRTKGDGWNTPREYFINHIVLVEDPRKTKYQRGEFNAIWFKPAKPIDAIKHRVEKLGKQNYVT